MPSFPVALVFLFIALQVVSGVLVSRRLLSSDFYESRQKRFQLLLIWLLPIVGVVLVWTFLLAWPADRGTAQDLPDDIFESGASAGYNASPGDALSSGSATGDGSDV